MGLSQYLQTAITLFAFQECPPEVGTPPRDTNLKTSRECMFGLLGLDARKQVEHGLILVWTGHLQGQK